MDPREQQAAAGGGALGVETAARAAAVRASRLLEQGAEESFDRITALAATITGTTATFLTVVDDRYSMLKGAPHSSSMWGPDGTLAVPARDTPCQFVVDSGEPVAIPDTDADPRTRDLPQIKELGVAAWVGVPIRDPDGMVLGNLCAGDSRARSWSDTEIAGLRTLAAAVDDAIALRLAAQHLRTYAEQTAELARTLQQSLLPQRPPRMPGITIATRFAPGGTGAEVLGDFYDIVPTATGFAVVVGDVCGKGAAAARTTALARSAVRTAAHTDDDPLAVLSTANEVLLDWFGPHRSFVTAAYAALTRDQRRWNVRLGSAGHPPGFLRRAAGAVETRTAGGRVLGLLSEHTVGLDRLTLEPGDTLVLYTDGITEARDRHGHQLDEHGVAGALTDSPADADAEHLADLLVTTAHRHAARDRTGSDRAGSDDLAVVVLQVPTPTGATDHRVD